MWLFEDEIHEYIVSWGGAMLGDGIQIIKELQGLTWDFEACIKWKKKKT